MANTVTLPACGLVCLHADPRRCVPAFHVRGLSQVAENLCHTAAMGDLQLRLTRSGNNVERMRGKIKGELVSNATCCGREEGNDTCAFEQKNWKDGVAVRVTFAKR